MSKTKIAAERYAGYMRKLQKLWNQEPRVTVPVMAERLEVSVAAVTYDIRKLIRDGHISSRQVKLRRCSAASKKILRTIESGLKRGMKWREIGEKIGRTTGATYAFAVYHSSEFRMTRHQVTQMAEETQERSRRAA